MDHLALFPRSSTNPATTVPITGLYAILCQAYRIVYLASVAKLLGNTGSLPVRVDDRQHKMVLACARRRVNQRSIGNGN
jgi:hypothetical protein